MARKRKSPPQPKPPPLLRQVGTERAARLYQLINLIGRKGQDRDTIVEKLDMGVRQFYRDLETLREWGIAISLENSKYRLQSSKTAALTLLPFPDPKLTLGEVEELAKGRTKAHRKLKALLKEIKVKPKPNTPAD